MRLIYHGRYLYNQGLPGDEWTVHDPGNIDQTDFGKM